MDISLGKATFLVGLNGAGKSNFIRSLWILGRLTREPLDVLVEELGGIETILNRNPSRMKSEAPHDFSVAVTFSSSRDDEEENSYGFGLRATDENSFVVRNEQAFWNGAGFERLNGNFRGLVNAFSPFLEEEALALPLIAGMSRLTPLAEALSSIRLVAIVPERLRDFQVPDGGQVFNSDGSNAASVLREMIERYPERHLRLCEFLGTAVPGILDVRPKRLGNRLTFEFTQTLDEQTTLKFDALSMSDGTLRIVGLLIALLQSPSPTVLMIEEPEAAVHPGALAVLLDAMKEAKERGQLLVTTQSPELLDADWITEDDVRIVEWSRGFSRIRPLAKAARDMVRTHLFTAGELLRSNALVGDPTSA